MNARPPSVLLRLHSRLWPVLVVALGLLELFSPSRVWVTLLIILGGTWLISFLWTRSLARALYLQREMRYGWAQVGDQLEERFTVMNDSRLPGSWLEVEDHSNLPGYVAGRVTSVGAGETLTWKTEGVCTRRGLFTLGPTSLRAGDPLGLCSTVMEYPNSTFLLVLPPVLSLPAIEISAGGRAGEGRRPRREALETTVSVDTVREYVPGDPLKSIHWPTSVRKNALYVRQFEHTPSSDWWIYLDLNRNVQLGSGQDSTDEHAIILAASLADRGIRQGHAVGLVACGEELVWLPPQRSSGHLMNLLRALALVQRGERPLAELLAAAPASIHYGASLIVITPDLRPDWFPGLLQLVKKGITPTVLLLDPQSFGGERPASGAPGLLEEYGIPHHLIQRELLDRPEARPGRQGQWEWRVVGRGKAVAIRRPHDTDWRQLG